MANLPAERRQEILAEIEEHIAEDLAERPAATDADVRNALERVGDPADIAYRFRLQSSRNGCQGVSTGASSPWRCQQASWT
jgi:hypothetical protein